VLLSARDFDLLRFLRWCRCVSPSELRTVFTETEILNLMGAGLVKAHAGSATLILTINGHRLLDEVCGADAPHVVPSYRESDIARRVRTSKLVLTAYRAGLHIFTTDLKELASGSGFFMPALTRGRGSNPWGNTRVAAIGRMGDLLCAFHNIYPDCGKLAPADELRAFTGNTADLDGNPAMVLCGESYETLLTELEASAPDTGGRLVRYGEAYRRMPFPVHLLSCDETGAMQLQIMAEPDYRSRLTRAALRGQYRPPPDGLDCDAAFDGVPFYMAADMNLRRLDAAVETARDLGYSQIAMVALKEQVESLLGAKYKNNARIFSLTQSALTELFGHPPALYMPPEDVYRTKKGDVLHAPLIRADRKALEACGEK
jgi:hypothetical protein